MTLQTFTRSSALLLGLITAAAAGAPTLAQVAYVPPNAERPRFGGEFSLSPVGPVAGYWPTECRMWNIRAQENRTGPKASPETAATLERFVSGLIQNKPNYPDFTPAMTAAVRKDLPTSWASIARMGGYSVAKRIAADEQGRTIYVVDQAGGRTHWTVALNAQGKIDSAFLCAGQGL